uniref:ATP-dependent helicase HrpA n=1 Tax=Candidatus Kentrum eta TaxID=2126337 RepID=A0A450V7C7_9GAMM|nr:MAG: ATP-dependent helicase HrpA [Candidatus Kentron sp. H]VFK01255.1 MAG: ATP-dependent helicase HrpA [Candidatus Kentron sp. H]VFK04659.1 MAG: ATP-dependent helicase HrpA [Candidatus Kentron sp. H]
MPLPPVEDLPIHTHRDEIIRAIADNPVTVIQGDTGSGKSTQLPQFCLAMGRGAKGLIGHTQPRRVAARSVAARIAEELGEQLAQRVGYQVRFTARTGPDTRIKLMTDGILLAEIQGDRRLTAYDTLIIDEVHERSLTLDFLLGYLKQLLPWRPDLKVILASATIDVERFSRHFDDAPVIAVSGRTFPVEVRYWPSMDPEAGAFSDKPTDKAAARTTPDAVADAVRAIVREPAPSGLRDILVFLAGEQEIRESAELLQKPPLPDTELLPLFGRLNAVQQDRIFAPHARRHVVLATNIAETSLTVPGIGFVIDAGMARISRYSHQAKVQRLPIEPVSQASANQRKGRCGRVAPGVCIRLYSEEDFEARPAFTEPEIRRTNLATVILRMKALGFGDVAAFPFLDKPDRRYISDGLRLLKELGALDKEDRLTQRGRALARLPVDPRMGRMILAGGEGGCLAEVLVVAAALSIPNPREFSDHGRDSGPDPGGAGRRVSREKAVAARARFQDGRSDFTELLKIWADYQEKRRELSSNRLQKHCRRYFLSYRRMREWHELHQQLSAQAREMGLPVWNEPASYARIHRALLTGLLGHVGYNGQEDPQERPRERSQERARERRSGKGNKAQEYTAARSARFLIGRDSVLHNARPRWVMAAELVQTSRTYAHNVARIRPEWIERAGRDLMKTTYFDSHWDETHGEVMAYERLTLYGLTIIPRRRIPYAAVNPEAAREIFIEAALVEGGDAAQGMSAADRDVGATAHDTDPPARGVGAVARGAGDAVRQAGRAARRTPAFLAHNRTLVSYLREMEQRSRRPDAFAGDAALYTFYDGRIPEAVVGNRSFQAWRKQAERVQPDCLFLSPEDLCEPKTLARIHGQFPDEIIVRGRHFPLSYRFDPGHGGDMAREDAREDTREDAKDEDLDGVTVTLLQNALYQPDPGPFQWLVPGLLEEKVFALLWALPKPLRRRLPPLAETARNCFTAMESRFMPAAPSGPEDGNEPRETLGITYPDTGLLEELGEHLRRTARIPLSPEVWREDRLAPYLRMNFRVIDADGKTLRMGRDLAELQRALAARTECILPPLPGRVEVGFRDAKAGNRDARDAYHRPLAGDFHRDGLRAWTFPDLPPSVEVALQGTRFQGYPALLDQGESVSLRLVDTRDKATELSRFGVCRLLMLAMPREARYLKKNLPDLQALCLAYATLNAGLNDAPPGGRKGEGPPANACEALREELAMAIVERTFTDAKAPIRTRAAFRETLERHGRELMTVANALCSLVGGILTEYRGVVVALAALQGCGPPGSLADISDQLNALVFRGFIRATPAERLPHLPRYLQAMARRLQRLAQAPDKDRRKMEELRPLIQAYAALAAADLGGVGGRMSGHLPCQRWLLEELRVSLFAQELGTAEPVSVKRLQKQLGQ